MTLSGKVPPWMTSRGRTVLQLISQQIISFWYNEASSGGILLRRAANEKVAEARGSSVRQIWLQTIRLQAQTFRIPQKCLFLQDLSDDYSRMLIRSMVDSHCGRTRGSTRRSWNLRLLINTSAAPRTTSASSKWKVNSRKQRSDTATKGKASMRKFQGAISCSMLSLSHTL